MSPCWETVFSLRTFALEFVFQFGKAFPTWNTSSSLNYQDLECSGRFDIVHIIQFCVHVSGNLGGEFTLWKVKLQIWITGSVSTFARWENRQWSAHFVSKINCVIIRKELSYQAWKILPQIRYCSQLGKYLQIGIANRTCNTRQHRNTLDTISSSNFQ